MSRNPGLTSVQGTPELSKRDWPPNGVETFYANHNDDQPLQHELFDTIYQLLKDITWWPKFNPRCFLSFGVKRTRADLMYPASSGFSRPDPETICGLCPYEDLNSLTAWSFKSTDCFVSERILPIYMVELWMRQQVVPVSDMYPVLYFILYPSCTCGWGISTHTVPQWKVNHDFDTLFSSLLELLTASDSEVEWKTWFLYWLTIHKAQPCRGQLPRS